MRINYLTKAIPFLFTFLLITFLSISNQKQYTKLRILIWNTPSLSLGTYLAISSGSGFILSFLMTSNFAKIKNFESKETLQYKDDNRYDITNEYSKTNTNIRYDNTLIERDIKDPSPTINASFRIIGRKQRDSNNEQYDDSSQEYNDSSQEYDDSTQFNDSYFENTNETDNSNKLNSISNDWNDETYKKW